MTPALPWDVERCDGRQCPLKKTCLRHLAPPVKGKDHVHFGSPPYDHRARRCAYYLSSGQTNDQTLPKG